MKKLLIWDGDETLWRGTITEGTAFLSNERVDLCLELARRGVLQAVASYNRPEDITERLFRHGLDTVFLHSRATLNRSIPKSAMVNEIKKAYDISRYEDIAFVDDDHLNLEEVHQRCHGISVLHPFMLDAFVSAYLTKPAYTDEDLYRVSRYRSEEARRTAAAAYGGDQQAFLAACNIVMKVEPAVERDTLRLQDLFSRAHRTAALAPWLRAYSDISSYAKVTVARVSDRYGEYGLSGFIVEDEGDIEGLVVSCRTQGRGVGSALLGWKINQFIAAGSHCVAARWIKTQYNEGVEALYKWYGFNIDHIGNIVYASAKLPEPVKLPHWISIL